MSGNPMTTGQLIQRLRRDVTVGVWLQRIVLAVAGAALALGIAGLPWADIVGGGLLLGWMGLLTWSLKAGPITAEAGQLLAMGKHEAAQKRVEAAATRFGVLRPLKLATLHQLAMLRHAQGRFGEAQHAATSLLQLIGRRGATLPAQLLLADSALEADDLPAAREAINRLRGQTLTAKPAALVMLAQLDYQGRVQAWPVMLGQWREKLELAALLRPEQQALVSALLGLAAKHEGHPALSADLARRATLLSDAGKLIDRRPQLAIMLADAKGASPESGLPEVKDRGQVPHEDDAR
jgi:hypothetical protein